MEAATPRRASRYDGEDTRPTSSKEIWGWYAYGLAAEVFAVCGVGSFLPVTIEQLARERGVLRSDGVTPCIATAIAQSKADRAFLLLTRGLTTRENSQCVIHILGTDINTSSFALYTFSISVLVQAIVLVSISAIADHGRNRKIILLVLGFGGAIACMMFLFVFPDILLVGSLLAVITVTCLGNSNVLLNSFLPLLVSNHPSIQESGNDSEIDVDPLLPSQEDDTDSLDFEEPAGHSVSLRQLSRKDFDNLGQESAALKLSNQISSKGVGIGYAAAVLVQIFSILILITFSKLFPKLAKSSTPMRIVLFIVGLWWAAFTIPAARWLRRRPGPPLPLGAISNGRWSWFSYIAFAWSSLWQTVKVAVELRQVLIFLIGWFLLSDATATISSTAILLARTELHMGTASVAGLSITAMVSGILGAFAWPKIGRRYGLQSNQIIMACVALFEIVPLYGLLGFIPRVQSWGVGGLQKQWEIFPLAFIHGFVMGGLSSHCRAFFGILIPPGSEAAFYALMAVTDKGSSVVGPAIAGRIVDRTGSVRSAFWFLAPLILLPIPFIWYVDVERGRVDAMAMAAKLRNWKIIELEERHATYEQADESEDRLIGS